MFHNELKKTCARMTSLTKGIETVREVGNLKTTRGGFKFTSVELARGLAGMTELQSSVKRKKGTED